MEPKLRQTNYVPRRKKNQIEGDVRIWTFGVYELPLDGEPIDLLLPSHALTSFVYLQPSLLHDFTI